MADGRQPSFLLLVREAKVDAERRVDVAVQLVLLGQLIRVVGQELEVVVVQGDDVEVGGDARRRDRLGDHGAASFDCKRARAGVSLVRADKNLRESGREGRKEGEDARW